MVVLLKKHCNVSVRYAERSSTVPAIGDEALVDFLFLRNSSNVTACRYKKSSRPTSHSN